MKPERKQKIAAMQQTLKAVQSLLSRGPMTTTDIALALNRKRDTVEKQMWKFRDAGAVEAKMETRQGPRFNYWHWVKMVEIKPETKAKPQQKRKGPQRDPLVAAFFGEHAA